MIVFILTLLNQIISNNIKKIHAKVLTKYVYTEIIHKIHKLKIQFI